MTTRRKRDHERRAPRASGVEAAPPGASVSGGAAQGGGAEASPDAAARIEQLAAELEETRGRHLRLAADFENFKKRARQEQMDTIQYAAATLAQRLLPVLDDGERALSHAPEGVDAGWLKGVQMTFHKLEEALAAVGVEAIEAVGTGFDPSLHEAIGSEESTDHPEDAVIAELRRGYRMHDRVLRPALVRVARKPA